ncbi:MAG: HD domain-containing protein [Bacteroidota bacterium]
MKKNKRKIINDPVYGFINTNTDLLFDIIQHPYFQRLRRIKQLGLTDLVYPGALHTRFHHALGAMHLMGEALKSLRSKNHLISDLEYEAAQIAILLHDVGHGPFSHVLEASLLNGVHHEEISQKIMEILNEQFDGRLSLAIEMFTDLYPRKFFNQLISSQLDIDRLDYLNRDSFFTGVSEASIGSERIIKMLNIVEDKIVVEQKGIYSIENFLNARRFMYWQVYLHKTAIAAEEMLIQIIKRAKAISKEGGKVETLPSLQLFIDDEVDYQLFNNNPKYIEAFLHLDDYDIWASIKLWANHPDYALSTICKLLLNRNLFKIELADRPFSEAKKKLIIEQILNNKQINNQTIKHFFIENIATNSAYQHSSQNINILTKEGKIEEISVASDLPTIKALSNIVKKYYICWPKDVSL